MYDLIFVSSTPSYSYSSPMEISSSFFLMTRELEGADRIACSSSLVE
jgi:hypothetical protein